MEYIPNNPSMDTKNETIRNIIENKQETTKKTFNLFSEKKNTNGNNFLIEYKLDNNEKFYSKFLFY